MHTTFRAGRERKTQNIMCIFPSKGTPTVIESYFLYNFHCLKKWLLQPYMIQYYNNNNKRINLHNFLLAKYFQCISVRVPQLNARFSHMGQKLPIQVLPWAWSEMSIEVVIKGVKKYICTWLVLLHILQEKWCVQVEEITFNTTPITESHPYITYPSSDNHT